MEAINTKVKATSYNCALVANDNVWKKIGTINNLVCQPSIDNVSALYHSTKCFLHISRQEGLSYALLEAIYSGCIVICSDIEQNLFATEFPTVIFVQTANSDDLAHKMDMLLAGNINITDEMVNQSKKMIREKYSIDSWVKKIQSFYFV